MSGEGGRVVGAFETAGRVVQEARECPPEAGDLEPQEDRSKLFVR